MRNKKAFEIFPGVGLGHLRFGFTMAEVEEVWGGASECRMEEDGEYSYQVLIYEGGGIWLFFHQEYDLRLGSIEVDSSTECSLFGEPVFPKSRDQVLELLHRNLPPAEVSSREEGKFEGAEQTYFRVPSLGANFYFDLADNLEEVQWRALMGPDDEIIWPDRGNRLRSEGREGV